MFEPMTPSGRHTVHTRASMVRGLQGGDEGRWRQFYELYGPVIRGFAIKSGLNDSQADDVLQETAVAVARNLPAFRYDPKVCRFKTWLLNQTAWRVKDHLRKDRRREAMIAHGGETSAARSGGGNAAISVDPVDAGAGAVAPELEALWEGEWRATLLAQAVQIAKAHFGERQFQIFDLNVLKGWPAGEVAKSLGVSTARVYLTKHRVSAAVQRAVKRLASQMDAPPDRLPAGTGTPPTPRA